jgi:short/branched chain acyl-CoA dehydrogenase
MGCEIPEKYGGAGSSFFNSIIAIEELAKVDSCIGGLVDIQNTVVNTMLLHNGSEEQKSKYCPGLAKNMVSLLCLIIFIIFVLQSKCSFLLQRKFWFNSLYNRNLV